MRTKPVKDFILKIMKNPMCHKDNISLSCKIVIEKGLI